MKKRIQCSMMAVIIITMFFVLAASVFYLSEYKITESRKILRDNIQLAVELGKEESPLVIGSKISSSLQKQIRVTMIHKNGKVIFDSKLPSESLEDHSLRVEFDEAKRTGYGEDIRESVSTGQRTLYVCLPFHEDYFLRMSMPLNAIHNYITTVMPPISIFVIILTIMALFAVNRVAQHFIRPYQDLSDSIEGMLAGKKEPALLSSNSPYPEIVPIVRNLQELDNKLQSYVSELREKSREVENILSAVEDGILVLNRNMDILTINQMAEKLFPNTGNFKVCCRNYRLLEKIDETLETGKAAFLNIDILSRPGKTYRCLVSPAKSTEAGKEQVIGVVLTISNITELKKLEQMRSEFVSNFSHEMKSPLTSMRGFAELIKNDMVKDPDKIKSYLSIIITESTRLVNLINDMLKLSEIETQLKGSLAIADINLRDIVERIQNMLTFQAEAKEICFTVEGNATIQSDESKVTEILLNIMDNAVKYGKMKGIIKVTIWEEEKAVAVSVWDNGLGIPADKKERIFERFYRIDKARSRKSGSTGLGLSIVKHDLELLGGTIQVESEEDQYSEMMIRFKK